MTQDIDKQAPYPIYTEVIDSIPHQQLASEVCELREAFEQSFVIRGHVVAKDLTRRNSLTLRDMQILQPYTTQILSAVDLRWQQILQRLRVRPFRIKKRSLNCLAYEDGGFFKRHIDFLPGDFYPRRVTWIYYFFKEPRAFAGGDLVFFEGAKEVARIVPSSGLLVAFPSQMSHEATSVVVQDSSFKNARFSLNCFVSGRPTILGASKAVLHSLDSRYPVLGSLTKPVYKGLRRVLRPTKSHSN